MTNISTSGTKSSNITDGDTNNPNFAYQQGAAWFKPSDEQGLDAYVLAMGSAAEDAGIDVGLTEDFSADLRPMGTAFDNT